MVSVVVWGAFALTQNVAPPVLHRAWTHLAGERAAVLAVRNRTVYFNSRQRTGALDLATGKVLWEKKRPDWSMRSAISAKHAYVLAASEKASRLVSYDLANGRERVVLNLPKDAKSFALWKNRILLVTGDRRLVSYDAATAKKSWTKVVGDGKRRGGVSLDAAHLCGDVLVLALDDLGWECYDPATGKLLWKKAAQFATNGDPAFLAGKVFIDQPHLMLVEPRTGKELWRREGLSLEFFGVSRGVLIAESSDQIIGLDLKNGKTLWSKPGGDQGFSSGWDRPTWIGDATGVMTCHARFAKFTAAGKELWGGPVTFDGWPAYYSSGSMICSDGDRILGYRPGPYAQIPSDAGARKAFAERAVKNFERLDRTEVAQVEELAEFSSEPLIRRFVEWAKLQQAQYDRKDYIDDEFGMLWYGLTQNVGRMLARISRPEDTPALKQAIEDLGPENFARQTIVAILGTKGRPEDFIETFIEELRMSRTQAGERNSGGQTLKAVATSKHPSAVRFMIEILEDPTAPDAWRHEAFVHLAGTGGEAGIAAVRSARAVRGPRKPWWESIEVSELVKHEIISELQDREGNTWRLFHHYALGNRSDLFIARKTANGWERPIFAGIFTQRTWHLPAPKDIRGVPVAEFLKTEWIRQLPSDSTLRADDDGDGLANLVEKRFGTDPQARDTDQDGLDDAVDPCPAVAPRVLSDTEKIVAAVVEARFFGQDWLVPAMIEVKGIEPFELYGYQHPLFWETASYKGELSKMYGAGMNQLSLLPYAASMTDDRTERPIVQISADGKSAATLISRYSGGLNGDGIAAKLIKVGDEWFVVDLTMLYVS